MFINLSSNQVVQLTLSVGLMITSFAHAAPGDLDPAFGTNGQSVVSLGIAIHTLTGVVAQGDGKYLVSYEAPDRYGVGGGIARFNADHTLDDSWGYRGVVGARNSYAGYSESNTVSALTSSKGQVLAIENDGGFGNGGNLNGQYPLTFVSRYTANGQLDMTFGGYLGGKTNPFPAGGSDTSQRYNAIAVAPDEKIVVAGESSGAVLIARFSAAGNLDTSFGNGGWTRLDVGGAWGVGLGVAVQPDGKIVVVGNNRATLSGFVLRLDDTGALDVSFNGTGFYMVPTASGATDCRSVLLDGARIVVGCSQTSGGVRGFLLLGLTVAGTIDAGFINTLRDTGGTNDALYSLFKHPDGRIFAVGRGGEESNRIAVLAVNANGTPASGFADNGLYVSPEAENSEARAVGWNGSELIVVGSRTVGAQDDAVLATFTPLGARSSITYSNLSFSDGRYLRVKALPGGQILAVGNTVLNGISNFLASRLNANGALDTTFGAVGHSTISTLDYEQYGIRDFALQTDGKIVMTGDFGRGNPDLQSVAAARMLANGGVDTSFNAGGTPGQSYLSIPDSLGLNSDVGFSAVASRVIRVQTDGKILVATRYFSSVDSTASGRQSIIVRFNSDGTVDSSYGVAGVAKTAFAGGSQTRAMDLDSAGRAMLVGAGNGWVQLARFDTSGGLDPAFGTGGMMSILLPSGMVFTSVPTKAIVLPSGKMLVVINAKRAGDGMVGLMRVDATGGLDTTFGDGGFSFSVAAPGAPDGAFAHDAAIMPNGRIVLVITTNNDNIFAPTPALARFLPNGTRDNNFGTGGVRYYPDFEQILGVDAMNDGSLVLSGAAFVGGQTFGLVLKTVSETSTGLNLLAVKSGKAHGAAGTFQLPVDISQALAGSITVEPRALGAAHTLVFQFDGPVDSIGGVTAEDALGAQVGTASATRSGNDATVTLSDVSDKLRVKVSLTGINGSTTKSVSVGFLVGDVNDSQSVDPADVSALKARAGQIADASNFRFDVNTSGTITASDIAAAKARTGATLQ